MIYLISMQRLPNNKRVNGQILINMLVAIALFAILAHALFTLISASYSIVAYTRARVAARNIAQKKIEEIRNMTYNEIGTQGGIPSGLLLQNEYFLTNGLRYLVNTSIVYVDDQFDGSTPIDLLPTDYKRVRIDVSWEGLSASDNNPVTLITDIAPSGVETTVGGGTLSILVFDANAQPVAQADVLIVTTDASPQVNLTLQTADNGRVILPGAPECKKECYKITVSKDDYSTERTYSSVEIDNPNKPHVSVLEGELTEISFAIDRVSKINITSSTDRDSGFEPLPDIAFQMRSDKTIGTDKKDNPIYKYEDVLSTDEDGELELEDFEWGNYYISVDTDDGWDIAGSNPLTPLTILPNGEYDFSLSLSSHTDDSLLIAFTDPSGSPIASVSASLFDNDTFVEEKFSGIEEDPDFGQVFFPNLNRQFYDLVATASGYLDFEGSMDVYGNSYEEVILNTE
jgi:hypothetical protein